MGQRGDLGRQINKPAVRLSAADRRQNPRVLWDLRHSISGWQRFGYTSLKQFAQSLHKVSDPHEYLRYD